MNAIEAIQSAMDTSGMVLKSYVGDLSDEELLRRPAPGCNHLAWQLGHLIASESQILESLRPGAGVKLPDGFAEQHSKEQVGVDDPAQFRSKQEYLELFDQVRSASRAAVAETSEAELDAPAPENFRKMFPTAGAVYVLLATHPLMHAGQFVPVRRSLNKPIVI